MNTSLQTGTIGASTKRGGTALTARPRHQEVTLMHDEPTVVSWRYGTNYSVEARNWAATHLVRPGTNRTFCGVRVPSGAVRDVGLGAVCAPCARYQSPEYEIDAETGCWNWTRTLNARGYGTLTRNGFSSAHRWYYATFVGPIPPGQQIDHLCRNHSCVNPEHLEPVTPAENSRRGVNAKLTPADVAAIRASDEPRKALAERYGIDLRSVFKIRSGDVWGKDGARSKRRKAA